MRRALLLVGLCCSSLAFAQLGTEDEEELPGTTKAIQARAYSLTYEIAAGGGFLPLDPYTKQLYAGGSMVAHFTDTVAWQIARGGYAYNWASGLRQQLERDFGVLPNAFEQVAFFVGTDLMLTPFYGKSSVANRTVIHYEAYLL